MPSRTSSKILYHKFSVGDRFYVYDTATNSIIEVPEVVHQCMDDYFAADSTPSAVPEEAQDFLTQARQDSGLFQRLPNPSFSKFLSKKHIRTALDRRLARLTINVTNRCNNRCTYCIYSGQYEGMPTHGHSSMPWDIAKRSIDYFAAHSADARSRSIAFYGGEPILAWPVVEQGIARARELLGREAPIALITNATLLDAEKIAYLIEHDIEIQVSLDGPEDINDAQRVLANGRGTHASVMAALTAVRAADPEYFRRRVAICATMDLNKTSVVDLFRYFSEDPFDQLYVRVNPQKSNDSSAYEVLDSSKIRHISNLEQLIEEFLAAQESGSPFHYQLFHALLAGVFNMVASRKVGLAGKHQSPNACCIPGGQGLCVDTDGAFYPCEKLLSPSYEIGDVDNGVSLEKVQRLLHTVTDMVEDMCGDCWAYRLCNHCLVHCDKAGQISKQRKAERCEELRKMLAASMERFAYILQREPADRAAHEFSLRSTIEKCVAQQ